MENKRLRSVLQRWKRLKAHAGFTASPSTVKAIWFFFGSFLGMVTFSPNKTKTLQNPHRPCRVSQTPGMLVKLRLLQTVSMELEEEWICVPRAKHINPVLLNAFTQANGRVKVPGAYAASQCLKIHVTRTQKNTNLLLWLRWRVTHLWQRRRTRLRCSFSKL